MFQLMNNFICGLLQRPVVIVCFSVVVNFTQYIIFDALLSVVVTCVFLVCSSNLVNTVLHW